MRFCLVFFVAFLFSGNSISQTVDQAEFTGSLESADYAEINCYMPYEICEGKIFSTTFTAIPKSNSGADLIIITFYAYFSDSTLFLCSDSSALNLVQSSGYLNESKLTLFSPVLSFANAKTYPVILTKQNEKFTMHQNDTEDSEIQYVNQEDEIEELDISEIEIDSLELLSDTLSDCRQLLSEATFPGGNFEFLSYIQKSIKFTDEMKDVGISGNVYISFVINTDGSISNVTLLKGLHDLYDAEAIRVIENMPDWIPALNSCNQPVRMRKNIPIKFEVY